MAESDIRFVDAYTIAIGNTVLTATGVARVSWDDNQTDFGDALGRVRIFNRAGAQLASRSTDSTTGSNSDGSRGDFELTWDVVDQGVDAFYTIAYGAGDPGYRGTPSVVANNRTHHFDTDGTDVNGIVTVNLRNIVRRPAAPPGPPPPGPPPPPDVPPTPVDDTGTPVYVPSSTTSCPSPPDWPTFTCPRLSASGTGSNTGLSARISGTTNVSVGLVRFPRKLVTLKLTVSGGSSMPANWSAGWTGAFVTLAPSCSDITLNGVDTGGVPYSKPIVTSSGQPNGVVIFYNLDGGHDEVLAIESRSNQGPRPERTAYDRVCTTSTETVTSTNSTGGTTSTEVTTETCVCNPRVEYYPGAWPPCQKGINMVTSSGNSVKWNFEDGSGNAFDQTLTCELVSTRDTIPLEGPITLAMASSSLYMRDMGSSRFNVGAFRGYVNAGPNNILRFRNPTARENKSELVAGNPLFDDDDYAAFSEFRNYAGAEGP